MTNLTALAPDLEQHIGRRAERRLECRLRVEVGRAAGEWAPALLLDFSPAGFMLGRVYPKGAGRLWLCIEGCGTFEAEVRWTHDGACGCRFVQPLDLATARRIAALLEGAPPEVHPAMAKCVDDLWQHP